ncbi:MAG: acyltransferase domain-containing protein [Piscinibacter sp.]|nr:acyltransferase domain-containing protein [Piscinibacter sp.]
MTSAVPSVPAAQEPIAIVGMACVFPQAPDLATFWNNVLGCVDAVGAPVANWDADRYLASGRIRTSSGGYLKDLYTFDPREFGIMPNSMDGGEPDQFLALRVARDALLDAGYLGAERDHAATGIILGHSTYLHRGQVTVIQNNIVLDQTMALLEAALPGLEQAAADGIRRLLAAKLPPTNADTAPGLVPNVMTGRIANRLNLKGPNYLVDAACSSSLLAVGAAMDELRAGRSRLMIAGGVNASLPADVSAIFTQLGALSARGKVRPFEAGSDGTLLGEGLGMVVLKRLSDALADGDRVYATLRGIGQASDGRGTGLLAPSVEGESLAIRRAYDASGVDPASIGLIEAHGTGIPLGDKTEVAALRSVFGDRSAEQGSIALGSVKSMISHCIPAAGVAGLIKTALALHHRVLPPTLCEEVNPELGIELTRLFVNRAARPWIAPLHQPRRAGVDSFGFGGINTHAIVEQAPAQAARPSTLTDWPFELCRLSADSRSALADAATRLAAAVERNPSWRLAEIAAALDARGGAGEMRLALVVKSRDALVKGLRTAAARLQGDDDAKAWSTRGGAFFSAERLQGKLAFVFPGEGSQYTGMFADLAMCFDEVRNWLDFWRGLYPAEPGAARTDIAYPVAEDLSPAQRKRLEARLHDMDVGSEAVMVGGQAMFALLSSLGVGCDAMLGHSSGESSALAASGALPAHDMARLAEFIRELNVVYQRVLGEGKIPTGALLAVGALPSEMVHAEIAAGGLQITVAMDNCANQLVLYGEREAVASVQARLVAIGGICMPLPFDRGYHTPAFGAVSTAFRDYYKSIKLGAPSVPLYSCASAGLFPTAPTAVRKLAAAQWSSTVRFRETVLQMVADGVRCFVEVGPSANLSAFVGDILADQPHLALATNVRRKHGLEQLLMTLAQLWAHGRPVELGRLYATRRIAPLDLDADAAPPRVGVLLDNTMPTLRLTDEDRAAIRALAATGAAAAVPPAPAPASAPAVPAGDMDAATCEDASTRATAEMMSAHFDLMRRFLDQQQDVLAGWQGPATQAHAESPAVPEGAAPLPSAPFLDRIVALEPGYIVAECRLGVHRDAFLRDHVLSGPGSDSDPELLGLACVPLMVSLEIMAEACAALAGHARVSVIEDVRAFDWIALDDEELVLEVAAQADDAAAHTYRATLRQRGAIAVSARICFAPPAAGLPAIGALGPARPARWDGQAIYEVGMFHGPIFQSLRHVEGWNELGIDAELTPCSTEGFFGPGVGAAMVLNPILLDAMGQLAACWVAEHVGTDFNCFPSTIERIDLFEPDPAQRDGIRLQGRQHALDASAAGDMTAARSWDFEARDADGRPLVRVNGLVNVFFHVPHRFYEVRRDPLAGWLGAPVQGAAQPLLWQLDHLGDDFCSQSNSIFLRILAHAVLSFEERDEWRGLANASVGQRRQWLLGRLALKEAVRHAIHARHDHLLYPSDIVVRHDPHGAPFIDGWWAEQGLDVPRVSLTHNPAFAIAAVSYGGAPIGVDAEVVGRVQHPDWLVAAFTPAEQAWLAGRAAAERDTDVLRLWCAKEAASKWLGTGLQGAPEAFGVAFADAAAEQATVQYGDLAVPVQVRRLGASVVAVAEGDSRVKGMIG